VKFNWCDKPFYSDHINSKMSLISGHSHSHSVSTILSPQMNFYINAYQ